MKSNGKMRAIYLAFGFGVVLMNLSHLPGLNSEIGTTDLLSIDCDIDGKIESEGTSTCNVEKNKVRGQFTIRKVETQGASPAAKPVVKYEVESKPEGEFCADNSCSMKRSGLNTLAEAKEISKQLAKAMLDAVIKRRAEEKARKEKIAKCQMTEDGEDITKERDVLKCLNEKLADLSGEQAEDFYNDNIRDRLQALLQSKSIGDRALAMEALQGVGASQKINCAARPGMQATQNQYLNQPNLNAMMSSMHPVSLAGTPKSKERNFIAESACDLWAFGTYNHNMEFLSFAATVPGQNLAAIVQAKNALQSGWGPTSLNAD